MNGMRPQSLVKRVQMVLVCKYGIKSVYGGCEECPNNYFANAKQPPAFQRRVQNQKNIT